MNTREIECIDNLFFKDRPIHKVLFSSVTLDGLTSISAWFAYFNHCKIHGKEMTTKYRLPKSLNLSTLSPITSNTKNSNL